MTDRKVEYMGTIYFGGCSITDGTGYSLGKKDPLIYPNLVSTDVINDAEGGSSNLKIFTRASKAIIENVADAYVIQWSALHRHWMYPAPDTGVYLGSPHEQDNDFVVQFQLRNHDYGNILQLIDYTRVLTDMAHKHDSEIYFVNGLVTWSDDIDWMRKLVSDAKTDHNRFVENLQNNMELAHLDLWINPWKNMNDYKLDTAPLDAHPGPRTHKQIAELILEKLNERL